jgi:hypothetical protein
MSVKRAFASILTARCLIKSIARRLRGGRSQLRKCRTAAGRLKSRTARLAGLTKYAILMFSVFPADQAFAGGLPNSLPNPGCEGPDDGDVTSVVTIPANEGVDVFHFRAGALVSVVEFCVRGAAGEWKLVASHGTDQNKWSLLQPWIFPATVQIKTSVRSDGSLEEFRYQSRIETSYGYLFYWSNEDTRDQNDKIVYCYSGRAGCPTSRRVDFK